MDEIIKFLKSFGLGDKEIENVLKNVPVERTGLMGTNVATGVFLKGGKKEMSELPLITEKITNPFEVNFYKGKSKEEIIKRSEAGIKYLDEELKKSADLILNKNAQLTQEQKINFAKNLETKRKFEKDLEDFKTKPETPVLDIKTKEKIEDVEKLREEAGLMAPPTTPIGETQLKLKQVEQGLKDILKNKTNIDDILKDPIESQIRYAQLQRSGLVRAVAREIIEQDIKAGKLKLRPTVEKGMISPTGSGLDGDPIEVYRLYYGEDALEQLDSLAPEFNRSSTAKDAAQIAREKYPTIQPREKPIREYLTQNEIDEMTKKNPPDEFAKGGSVESLGLDYLTGMERNYAGRSNFEKGTIPRMLKFLIDKLADEKDFNRKLLERANPKAVQDLYIEKYGKLPSAEELKEIVNKELQGKYSIETANPKTGEVTTPKEPVTIAEKKYFYDKEEEYNKLIKKYKKAAEAHDELDNINIYDKIAPDQLGDVMAEMAGKNVDTLTDAQRRKYYTEAQTYLTDFIKIDRTRRAVEKFNQGLELSATDRHYLKFAQPETKSTYKQGDIITSENFGNTPFAPDLSGLEQARKMTKGMSLEEEMNMVLNRYDKSMFIKNEQGMVDVTNPENVQKMALLLKQDHPDIYKRLQEGSQIDELENFDITGRKPNAIGGRVGFSNGTEDAPSITLDTHDKAPDNMDKYPIKAGNLELGIMGAMSSGKSTPDPYVKINTADRNFTVRGKYNVPDTGISLLGDIGDIRSKSKVNIDVPQYNYKETIKDVMRANPYSVGIEYAPNQNKNISLRYDDQGNVTLRGGARFSKGGLGYLMGE